MISEKQPDEQKSGAENERKAQSCALDCADRDTHETICKGGNSSEFVRL